MKRQKKEKAPVYHSAEVFNHLAKPKKRKKHPKYPEGERIPHQLWYLAVALGALLTAFVAILLHC